MSNQQQKGKVGMLYTAPIIGSLPPWLADRLVSQGAVVCAEICEQQHAQAVARGDTVSATAFAGYVAQITSTAAYTSEAGMLANNAIMVLSSSVAVTG